MAGPTLPAQPDPTPDPNRRVPVHIHHITELLEQIHNLALRQGLSVDDMTEWELGMRRLCIGQGDHHPAFLRNHDAVEAFLVELREMEEQLHEQPFLALVRNRETGQIHLAAHYTVNGFRDSVEATDPLAFQSFFRMAPQHSLAQHPRVSGRYAGMMGLTTNGVAREGGYHFARF